MYKQRLLKQALQVGKHKDPHFLLLFDEKDILNWSAFIHGPQSSPYAEGIFQVKISLSQDYPIIAPKMYFRTKIFHPNIHFQTGEVCLDIIKNEWIPTWTLQGLCRAARYLLENPNADSPLNCDCGNLLRNGDEQAYKAMARMYTQQYALSKQEFTKRLNKKLDQKNQ